MSSSQMMFARLAAAMKRAAKRKADESDSDDSIDAVTNRGNKLRKRARYVHEGKLAPPNGPEVYKKTINHAGYERTIISERPKVYDDDGYEVDSEDDDESAQAARAAAAELYPYSGVKIEDILAPLTRPADLPEHPTLSRAFTSKPLTELVRQAREMLAKERASLWKMKKLLNLMSGDHVWAPCDMFETENDIHLFSDGRQEYREHIERSRARLADVALSNVADAADAADAGVDVPMADVLAEPVERPQPDGLVPEITEAVEPTATTGPPLPVRADMESSTADTNKDEVKDTKANVAGAPRNESLEQQLDQPENKERENDPKQLEEEPVVAEDGEALQDQEEAPEPRRMRTRAQAQAATDNDTMTPRERSATPSTNESFVHPFFMAPASARPNPDLGLPPIEAEETRRLLQLYIQKQEEVCRGSARLYDGLLKAERLRKTVYKWAKADGHVGEMSDGEDWYDKEEWGLTEDLKKGQDEEEEDAVTTAKKTRTRRQ